MEQVDRLLDEMSRVIQGAVAKRLDHIAEMVLKRAVEYRLKLTQAELAFNATGNLINSIFVGVYYGLTWQENHSYYATDLLSGGPTDRKMSAKSKGKPQIYTFNPFESWDGKGGKVKATVVTDKKIVTKEVIRQFARTYKPKVPNGYTIVLAYPVEYSRWVEKERESTGMALVEDEMTSKRKEIAKWLVSESPISDTRSGLYNDVFDRHWTGDLAAAADMSINDVFEQKQDAGEHYYVGRITLSSHYTDFIKEGESL